MLEVEENSPQNDFTHVEMDNDFPDEEEIIASTKTFGADPLRTLGEILAYCQVMYGAIQKLDEKLELLQARVTNIQQDHLSPQSFQVRSEESDLLTGFLHPQPHLICPSPPLPYDNEMKHLIPETHPLPTPSISTPSHNMRKMKLHPLFSHTNNQTTPPAQNTGKRKVILPVSFLRKASTMQRPTSAARFLLRSVFTQEELRNGSTKGDPARGLNQLDPRKINAIRVWLQKRYPKHELGKNGKDWKACLTVMNKGARYIRLKKCKPGSAGPIPEQEPAPPITFLEPMRTAEIDVELSDSDNDNLHMQKTPKRTSGVRSDLETMSDDEDLSEQEDEVYLGSPDRQVKVPQFALITALQRPSAALAARHLIKFMFSEEVLVRSNVYGNAEYGMEPLDHNKISALREHLCECFPELKLGEDGHDWKACVDAMNGCIRKTRHKCKKLQV